MNRSPVRLAFLFILLALACFALAPQALAACQEGCLTHDNTVLGDDALTANTGADNTAIGFEALFSNTLGFDNTAIGFEALFSNTTAFDNIATGVFALFSNTTGSYNTATGFEALTFNTTGDLSAATGFDALRSNTTGSENTATGANALLGNTTGSNNIALGYLAGQNLTTGSNNIDIGNVGGGGESGKIRIGTNGIHTNTFIAGISGVTVANGVGVIIDARGHLGTITSSARFKDEIKPMDKASEAILALKPVIFRYKKDLDPEAIPQFGLVAEQVEKVNPDLVARDANGKPYTVRYEAVNAMLLNEFLKEHKAFLEEQRKVQELEATIAKQQKEFQASAAHQQQQIEDLTAGLQKVSAELELSKAAPQTVLKNR